MAFPSSNPGGHVRQVGYCGISVEHVSALLATIDKCPELWHTSNTWIALALFRNARSSRHRDRWLPAS